MRQTNPVKTDVASVLGEKTVKDLWTAIYWPVLPFTPQDFSVEALLPPILFMLRWGYRRGLGKFSAVFSKEVNNKKFVSIEDVVLKITKSENKFEGFSGTVEKAILGDLLLSFCLENKKRSTGRTEQIQRIFPTHYFASWVDLPERVTNLRFVPEMIVSMLVNQNDGEWVGVSDKKSFFSLGKGFDQNLLLSLFGKGTTIASQKSSDKRSDKFDENCQDIGVDQLLTIRIAQECGEAPQKLKPTTKEESESISNQHPLAIKASKIFTEDFRVFLQAYGESIPRQAFLQMLESCLSLGITNIYLSTSNLLLEWEKTGEIPIIEEQKPWPLFVDCSSSTDHKLRLLSEEAMDDFLRRFDRVPIIMMCLRVLDQRLRLEEEIAKPNTKPYATQWINLLGNVRKNRHDLSRQLHRDISKDCKLLAEVFEEDSVVSNLLLTQTVDSPMRIAEALIILMRDRNQREQYIQALNSALMTNSPNGLAKKRKVYSSKITSGRRTTEATSIILTNTMLDFMVHRHLRKAAKGKGEKILTFSDFIVILRKRYGFFIDQAPPSMSIPSELLQNNRRFLEKRLRDLGLLIGVNDAESMKRLKTRFVTLGENND